VDWMEERTLLSLLTVMNNNDNGPGSLRQALIDATSGSTIFFDSSLNGQTIALTSGNLIVNKSVDIEGLGPNELAVSGGGNSRVFHITKPGVTVTIAGLTITGGVAPIGGGILNKGG